MCGGGADGRRSCGVLVIWLCRQFQTGPRAALCRGPDQRYCCHGTDNDGRGCARKKVSLWFYFYGHFLADRTRFQARAFVLLNISTSFAIILSALVAAGTVELTPKAHGSGLLTRYPYALPALLNAGFLLVVLVTAVLFLEEVCTAITRPSKQRFTMI